MFQFGAGVGLWYNAPAMIPERTSSMRVKILIILALVALLGIACGPEMASPTPRQGVATEVEGATPAPAEAATLAVEEAITATMPFTPTGGVDVALAAMEPVDGALAIVNGQEITWAEYEPELLQALYSVTFQYAVDWNQPENIALLGSFQDQILQTVVDRTLLRQLAALEGIEVSPSDVQALVEEEKMAIMESGQFSSWDDFKEQTGLSDEYFARLVEDNALVERVGEVYGPEREVEQVHARHILVADEETGEEVLARLSEGEDWALLAQEYSQDTSNKDNAGDLGWFPRGMMVSEFEEAAFSLEVDETSDLVQSDFGYHIIQVLEKGMQELDEETYGILQQQAFQGWLEDKKATADVSILVTFGLGE
jgi:foldase protein PrsA